MVVLVYKKNGECDNLSPQILASDSLFGASLKVCAVASAGLVPSIADVLKGMGLSK